MKRKYTKFVKFADIPQGTWFKDGTGRKMLKLQTTNGIVQFFYTCCHIWKNDTIHKAASYFNAVDDKGHRCQCPDWLEFLV